MQFGYRWPKSIGLEGTFFNWTKYREAEKDHDVEENPDVESGTFFGFDDSR